MSEVVSSQPANRYYKTFGLLHQAARQYTGQPNANSALSDHKWERPQDFRSALAVYYANGIGIFIGFNTNQACLDASEFTGQLADES